MALGTHPSLQAELTSWCKDVGIHETHAVMLFNVPADTEVAVIEDVMQAVKVLGRIRVRDDLPHILCWCCVSANKLLMPHAYPLI